VIVVEPVKGCILECPKYFGDWIRQTVRASKMVLPSGLVVFVFCQKKLSFPLPRI
jgi:hypothetical protein